MNILITGGLGFIGTELVAVLCRQKHYKITIVDNLSPQIHGEVPKAPFPILDLPNVEYIRCNVVEPKEYLERLQRAEILVHLAAETGTAQSMYKIAHYNAVNSQATANILEALANNKTAVRKFILASSRSIYGEGAYHCGEHGYVYPPARSIDQLREGNWEPVCPHCKGRVAATATPEGAPSSPASIYAATKYAQEDLVRIACTALKINAGILRFQNVYGAGQSLNNPYTGILSIFSTRIRRGLSLPIFEDGNESRDFVHVSDVVEAIRLSIEAELEGVHIYNVGSGEQTSVLQIANMLAALLDSPQEPSVTGEYRVGDIRHCFADISRIGKDLGFTPKVSLAEGLSHFVKWVLSQPLPDDRLDTANRELKQRNLMSQ